MLSLFLSSLKKQSGKTLIASGLLGTMQSLSYATSYYKPIRTGANFINNDAEFIKKVDPNIKTSVSYQFNNPSTPLAGSYIEGIKIDKTKIFSDFKNNILMTECHIAEGANSVSTPIDTKLTEAGIIKMLNLPLILVVNPILNNIDEIITGINYIYLNKLRFLGVIINEYNANSENLEHKYLPQLIKEYADTEVLGCFPHYDDFQNLSADTLISDTLNNLNIEDIFRLKIAKLS